MEEIGKVYKIFNNEREEIVSKLKKEGWVIKYFEYNGSYEIYKGKNNVGRIEIKHLFTYDKELDVFLKKLNLNYLEESY